jgi:hypothetical protein
MTGSSLELEQFVPKVMSYPTKVPGLSGIMRSLKGNVDPTCQY